MITNKISEALDPKKNKLSAGDRQLCNKLLTDLTSPKYKTRYFDSIPLGDIFSALKRRNIIVLDSDGTPWSGMLLGVRGQETFEIAFGNNKDEEGFYIPIDNSVLWMSWYKMQSGRYEIVVYVS